MDKSKSTTFGVSDGLDLSDITVPEIPKNIVFPDDLNKYLRDQVQYLTHENGMLYKNVSDLELRLKESVTKINGLTDELEKVQSGPQNTPTSSENLACSKIVELSKLLRERNSEIEIQKSKYAKLAKHVKELENDKIRKTDEFSEPQKPKNEMEEHIKQLTEKLSLCNNKLCEVRNTNTQLKATMKLANKLIQQEVGESFETIQSLINSNGTWRGRAQIICDLQQKNAEMREKLKMLEDKDKNKVISNRAEPTVSKWDKKLSNLTQENEELRNSVQDLKKKLDASRARNKVIESENTALRSKVSMYTEQNDRDREMITSLTAQVSRTQDIQNEAMRQKQSVISDLERTNKNLHLEIAKQTCKISNLNSQLDDQNRIADGYRSKIKRPQSSLIKVNQVNAQQLEAERLRLLELTKLTNQKLDSERSAHSETHIKYLSERQKAAKLEAKVARLQLERQSDRSSTYSYKASSSESVTNEDKLQLAEETIKALQTRLDVERKEHKNALEEFSKILSNYHFDVKKE